MDAPQDSDTRRESIKTTTCCKEMHKIRQLIAKKYRIHVGFNTTMMLHDNDLDIYTNIGITASLIHNSEIDMNISFTSSVLL